MEASEFYISVDVIDTYGVGMEVFISHADAETKSDSRSWIFLPTVGPCVSRFFLTKQPLLWSSDEFQTSMFHYSFLLEPTAQEERNIQLLLSVDSILSFT